MPKSNPPYAIWSIWLYLPLLPKLLFLLLCVIGIYSPFSAGATMSRLRALANPLKTGDVASIQHSLNSLRRRSTHLRRLIGAAFYLFGLVLFMAFQWAYITAATSKAPLGLIILENLVVYFAFAANAFSIFLILHSVQWFVSGQVDACASRLGAQPAA